MWFFLNILNAHHKNLQFTVEKSANALQFLDVDIKINEQDVDSWVWRKPTSAGLFLNFVAISPFEVEIWSHNVYAVLIKLEIGRFF